VAQNQVMIDALITLVELDDQTQLGLDFSYQNTFDSGTATYKIGQDFKSLFPRRG